MALTLTRLTSGVTGNAGNARNFINSYVTVPADQFWMPTSVRMKWVTCAKTGTRHAGIVIFDAALGNSQDVIFAPTQAASLTRTYDSYDAAAVVAAFINTSFATAPFQHGLTLSPGTQIIPNDYAAICDPSRFSYAAALIDHITATTLVQTGTSFPGSPDFVGFTLHLGPATAIITSHDNTTLTFAAGWSTLIFGTAEASDATSMTDNDATWTTDAMAGLGVVMGGSTATVLSNTATKITIDAWAPLAPTTGDYYFTGPFYVEADTVEMTVAYDAYSLQTGQNL